MLQDLWTIVLGSAEAAFVDVTVFVERCSCFRLHRLQTARAFIEAVERSKKYQPLIGALLGILPGCGGSILLCLYMKGSVSFGTIGFCNPDPSPSGICADYDHLPHRRCNNRLHRRLPQCRRVGKNKIGEKTDKRSGERSPRSRICPGRFILREFRFLSFQ